MFCPLGVNAEKCASNAIHTWTAWKEILIQLFPKFTGPNESNSDSAVPFVMIVCGGKSLFWTVCHIILCGPYAQNWLAAQQCSCGLVSALEVTCCDSGNSETYEMYFSSNICDSGIGPVVTSVSWQCLDALRQEVWRLAYLVSKLKLVELWPQRPAGMVPIYSSHRLTLLNERTCSGTLWKESDQKSHITVGLV